MRATCRVLETITTKTETLDAETVKAALGASDGAQILVVTRDGWTLAIFADDIASVRIAHAPVRS